LCLSRLLWTTASRLFSNSWNKQITKEKLW
jgi:hypothetical protein